MDCIIGINIPFFARDKQKASNGDPMLMNDYRQQHDENYEYYRANTNLKGEWGSYQTQATTVPWPSTRNMNETKTILQQIWVANPSLAIAGMNKQYVNSLLIYIEDPYLTDLYSKEKPGPGWTVIKANSLSDAESQLKRIDPDGKVKYDNMFIANHTTGPEDKVTGIWQDNRLLPFGNVVTNFSGKPDAQINALKDLTKRLTDDATVVDGGCQLCSNEKITDALVKVLTNGSNRGVYINSAKTNIGDELYKNGKAVSIIPNYQQTWLVSRVGQRGFHLYRGNPFNSNIKRYNVSWDIQMNASGGFNFNPIGIE